MYSDMQPERHQLKAAEVQQNFLTIPAKGRRKRKLIKFNVTTTTRYSDMRLWRPENGTRSAFYIRPVQNLRGAARPVHSASIFQPLTKVTKVKSARTSM